MSYCVNPACAEPTSAADDARICPSCNASLILRERYRSLRLLGQGGFGRTFLAVDESKGSKLRCVVKQLFPQQQNERQRASRMFRQEAQRLRSLEAHSQIPDLIDYFELDEQQYLVQEFIDGQDLAVALNSGKTSSPEAIVELLRSLLPVLQFMHEHQVIHRDIKPANIIRRDRDQQLFLVDLGAAKVATGTALARTGTTIGSAEYTAPEQLRGKAVFASDIYSLGMTCLHLLTGVSPFNLYNADEGRLAWQDYLRAPVDQRLSRILAGMTAAATRLRYGSAKDVLWELRDFSGVRTAPGARAATQPSVSSSSASSKAFVPVPRPSMRPELQQPPVFKPFSPIEPVQLPLAESDEPHTLISQRQEAAISTRSASSEPKDLLWSEEPSTLAELAVNVLAGERPLSALGERLKRDFSSRGAIRASIKSEFPDWATGDFAWVCGRTALTLLLILGVPALSVVGLQRVNSSQNSIARGEAFSPLPSSSNEDYRGEPTVTSTSPTQEAQKGTIKLSEGIPLASIKTTGAQPVQFELNPSEDVILITTLDGPQLDSKGINVLAEIWDLNSAQQRYALPMQSKFPPILEFSSDGKILFSQFFPEDQPVDMNALPDIQAWDIRSGDVVKISPNVQNMILQGSGPISKSGEATLVVFDPINSDGGMFVIEQTSGEKRFHAVRETGRFSNPQFHDSLMAFGASPIGGGNFEDGALIFDMNYKQLDSDEHRIKIRSTAFGQFADGIDPHATRYGDLKFDSFGRLYIGRASRRCAYSCLEVYEFNGFQPSYKHIPAQIPPFHELFFDKNPEQVILYIPAHLGAEPQLQVWNIETGSLVKRILLGESYAESVPLGDYKVPPLKISADATKLYTAHAGRVEVWDFQALLE